MAKKPEDKKVDKEERTFESCEVEKGVLTIVFGGTKKSEMKLNFESEDVEELIERLGEVQEAMALQDGDDDEESEEDSDMEFDDDVEDDDDD